MADPKRESIEIDGEADATGQEALPEAGSPVSEADDGNTAERLLERCTETGLTESQADQLSAIGLRAVLDLRERGGESASVGMRTLVTFAALGRGDFSLADAVLATPCDASTPELRLLDLAARLYRACVGAESDPAQPLAAMNALTEALVPVIGL